MADIATSLVTALNRVVSNSLTNEIAQIGLKTLKKSLDSAGFLKMENLKNYEVFSHVSGNLILFEIVLDASALEVPPEEQEEAVKSSEILESEVDKFVFRTYGLTKGGDVERISKMKDVRSSARDARKPARDARKPARDARRPAGRDAASRDVGHDMAKSAPRSISGMKGIRITKEGKISLSFEKVVTKTKEGDMKYPEGQFDGVMKDFMGKLIDVVRDVFVPELASALARYSI